MKTVWKFTLTPGVTNEVNVREMSDVLCVANQRDELVLYMLVDEAEVKGQTREFLVVGTGWKADINDNTFYVGTVVTALGDLVWHVFEVCKNE